MKHFKFFIAPFILTLLFCSRCNFKKKEDKAITKIRNIEYPKYAKNFFFSKNNDTKITTLYIVTNKGLDTLSYLLIPKTNKKKVTSNLTQIRTPIKRLIATSTTDIPYLEALNKEIELVGFAETKYISSSKTRQLISNGAIKDIGSSFQLNTETILELLPEVFISSSPVNGNKSLSLLKRNAITILTNNSWLETHPLGRAEWITVFGLLFDKEEEALQTFKNIEANYLHLKKQIFNSTTKPPIILSGNLYKDVWYAPAGDSFEAQLIADAKGNYSWKNSKGVGSLSLSIESILEKSQDSDIWLGGGAFKTIKELTEFEEKYALLKTTKTKRVYTKDLSVGPTGGLLYFETGALRPDWILEDLIQIFHPNAIEKTPFHYYKKLN